MGPKDNDWLIFAGDGSGVDFHFQNCVFFAGDRDNLSFLGSKNHAMEFVHCTFADTFPLENRVWMDVGNSTASTFDFRNCIVSGPDSQNVTLIAGSENSQAVFSGGVNLWSVLSANDADPMRHQGEVVDGQAEL